jgi:hypothetical protein
VLLTFMNFYQRFVRNYAKVITSLWNMLMTTGTPKLESMWNAELAFQTLKKDFPAAHIDQDVDPMKTDMLQTNASSFTIASFGTHYDGFSTLRLVNCYSWKWFPAKQNYDTYYWDLLAIVEMMKQWQHYLEGANHTVLIQWDHKNLKNFQT